MVKILNIDPPDGWRYGFPKPIPNNILKNESLMRIWLQAEGYPDIDLALNHSRYIELDIDLDQISKR